MKNAEDTKIFDTEEFVAPIKDGKFALYSNKEEKFLTDYIFDKISYIRSGNYFVVQKDKDIFLIDTNGNKKDFPRLCPKQDFKVEVLAHHRFVNGLHTISNGEKVGVIDQSGNMVIPFMYKTIMQSLFYEFF